MIRLKTRYSDSDPIKLPVKYPLLRARRVNNNNDLSGRIKVHWIKHTDIYVCAIRRAEKEAVYRDSLHL